ncbi:MAG: hypothetical protein GY828_07075 [Candidatus Gracilibacteria bacterium]|nr:hypothetical protein [Candidatus Gracilibacteria bacterium]
MTSIDLETTENLLKKELNYIITADPSEGVKYEDYESHAVDFVDALWEMKALRDQQWDIAEKFYKSITLDHEPRNLKQYRIVESIIRMLPQSDSSHGNDWEYMGGGEGYASMRSALEEWIYDYDEKTEKIQTKFQQICKEYLVKKHKKETEKMRERILLPPNEQDKNGGIEYVYAMKRFYKNNGK